MDNKEFEEHLGFNPRGRKNMVIEDGPFGKTVYKDESSFLKSVGVRMAIYGLVGVLGGFALTNYENFKALDKPPEVTHIDRDKLPDLIIGDRIYLANQTDEGITYKRLESSDKYRIQ